MIPNHSLDNKNDGREVTFRIRKSRSQAYHRLIRELRVYMEDPRYYKLDLNRSICVDACFFVGLPYVH